MECLLAKKLGFYGDIDQSEEKNGEEAFAALGVGDPFTCQTITQSGGRHLIFEYPSGYDLRNDASGKLAQHVDRRPMGAMRFGQVLDHASANTNIGQASRQMRWVLNRFPESCWRDAQVSNHQF